LAEYYANNSSKELNTPNAVTAIVVTYRGLDTLGEVAVLFVSAAGVGLLLSKQNNIINKKNEIKPSSLVISATHTLVPFLFLLGIYIFINGHLSPGGGFQGGAVIASATMLLILSNSTLHFNHKLLDFIESLSGFAYVLIGILGFFIAGGFLDNRIILLGEYGTLFSAGAIPLIYSFIGIKVGTELSTILDKLNQSEG